ncbi:hypothetical protein ASE01_02835 [Nocardioides sp. Root190]|uniref:tyrosine-protein phosphatase n=1 Tax=Nocardioides sp. Root190 TaxID=1736488 RepID=UPI0006F6B0B4|nr:tyrosine-protein phosphatase [Nocardioides sp. Root190]KRB80426.1 hypothetical protein ASE01_02835 [Nocardioides sp. Root190]
MSESVIVGPVNVRDVGGLPLDGGGQTSFGVLLRGDALYDGDGPPTGVSWPPAAVIDLRSDKERARSPYRWPASTTFVARQLFDAADLAQMTRRDSLVSVYRDMVTHSGPAIASLLDLMPDDGATYIHCAAGKDRTGASIAALLLLAGVPVEAVVADYQATNANIDGVLTRLFARGAMSADWDPTWAETPLEAITLIIDEITSHSQGARGWFLHHGAAEDTIERYQERMRS